MAGMSVGVRARAKTRSNGSSVNTQARLDLQLARSGSLAPKAFGAARTERCELFRVLTKTCQTEIQKFSFAVVRGKRSRVRSGSVRVADINLG